MDQLSQEITKKKPPVLVQIASAIIIIPLAIHLFGVLFDMLNSFEVTSLISFIVLLVILIAAFRLFSMKHWALYVVTAAEIIWLGESVYVGDLSLIWDGLVVIGIIAAWVHFKEFN